MKHHTVCLRGWYVVMAETQTQRSVACCSEEFIVPDYDLRTDGGGCQLVVSPGKQEVGDDKRMAIPP